MSGAILVAGAEGFFGRRLVDDLRRQGGLEVRAAARRECDLSDRAGIEAALRGAAVAICAAGPYQTLPLTLLEVCLERKVPYLDLADDRGFIRKARAFAQRAAKNGGPAVGIGWSTAPALSGLLGGFVADGMESIESIRIQIAPGNRGGRGGATVRSLLASLGKPIELPTAVGGRRAFGGTEPREFPFPRPIGSRRGFLVDVADHELFPSLFGAPIVEFRAGAELPLLNQGARALSWSARCFGAKWDWASRLFEAMMGVLGGLGTDAGALGVEIDGRAAGQPTIRRACVLAEHGGERIPLLPAALLAPHLASDPRRFSGLIPLKGWLDRESFERECSKRGLQLVLEEAAR